MPNVVRLLDDLYLFTCHRFSIEGSEALVLACMLAIGMEFDEALDLFASPTEFRQSVEQDIDTIL